MIRLYYYPGNSSLAPHILLEELGVKYELELVDRAQNAQRSAAYLALNPNGSIPAYTDGSLVLYETAAICLHLADTHPEAQLAPPLGTPERAHFYKWLVWLTNTLQSALLIYFYPHRWVGDPAAALQVKAAAETKIDGMIDQLEQQLRRHGGQFFLGEKHTLVDPYTVMLCRWTRGFSRPARSLPLLGRYLERMLARPAVLRAFEQEKIPLPWV